MLADSNKILLDLKRNYLVLRWYSPPIPAKTFSPWCVLKKSALNTELTGLDTSGLHVTWS